MTRFLSTVRRRGLPCARRSFLLSAGLALAAVLVAPAPSWAVVDDAHSYAMEAAGPYVEKGFRVRSDYWRGEMKPGDQKAIRHQLFKGNEYCFWFASDAEGIELTIGVYDLEGNPLEIEVLDGNMAKSARVNPPSTGTYVIIVTVKLAEGGDRPKDEPVDWALAYGYR